MNSDLIKKFLEIKNIYLSLIDNLNSEKSKIKNVDNFLSNYKKGIFSYDLIKTFYSSLNLDKDLDYYYKISITIKNIKDKYPDRVLTYEEELDKLVQIVENKYEELSNNKLDKLADEYTRKIEIIDKIIQFIERKSTTIISVSEVEYVLNDLNLTISDYANIIINITFLLQKEYEIKIGKEGIKDKRVDIEVETITDDNLFATATKDMPFKDKVDILETSSSLEESKELVGKTIKSSNSKQELSDAKVYLQVLEQREQEEEIKTKEEAKSKNCEEILLEMNNEYTELYFNVKDLLIKLNSKYQEQDYKKYSDNDYVDYLKLKEIYDIFVNTVEDYYKALENNEDIEIYAELLYEDYLELQKTYLKVSEKTKNNIVDKDISVNKLLYVMTNNNTPCALSDVKKISKEYYKTIIELLNSIKDGSFRDFAPVQTVDKVKGVYAVRHTQKKLRVIYKRVQDNCYAILGICVKKDNISKDYHNFILKRYEYYQNSEKEMVRLLTENRDEYLNMEDGITKELYASLGVSTNSRSMKSGE